MRFALTLMLLGSLTTTGCATKAMYSHKPKVAVIAHRGASAYAPENTLVAFTRAVEMDADYFELDVTLSKDDEIIVIHDLSVDRTTNGTGKVRDLTLAELKQLDAGSKKDASFAGEPLPTLEESLVLAKSEGIKVYIEIKNSADDSAILKSIPKLAESHQALLPDQAAAAMAQVEASGSANLLLTRKVIELVRSMKMQNEVVIQSFSPIVCLCSLVLAPDLRTEFLGSKSEKHPEEWPTYLLWTNLLGCHGHNLSNVTLTPELLKVLHRDGKTVAVYTVDDEADMRRLAEWRVDAIITNKPDVCLRVLTEMGMR